MSSAPIKSRAAKLPAPGAGIASGALPASSLGRETLPLSRYAVYFTLAGLGCAADLVSKELIFRWRGLPRVREAWWIIEPYVGIETSVNPGALFGMGAGHSRLFAVLSVGALVGIFTWLFVFRAAHDRWLNVALAFVTGGILGNLYDRLGLAGLPPQLNYGVRDWILFRYQQYTWPNFNIADSLLVTGAIMLVVHALLWREAKEPTSAKLAA